MNKKILIAHKYCGFIGGVEKYIFDTVSLLKKHGFSVYGIFEEELNQNSKQFKSIFDKVFFVDIDNIKQTIAELKKDNFEHAFIHKLQNIELFKMLQMNFLTTLFVHDHDYYCMRGHKYYSFCNKNCRRPFNTCICSICARPFCRDNSGKIKFRSVRPFLRRKLFRVTRKCDSFVVLSEHMKNNLILNKYPLEKIKKIYPVISVHYRKFQKGNKRELLYIGQLIRGKGVDILLKALTYIKGDFKLNIVGKGNAENSINNLVSEYGMQDKVNMVGFTLDTEKWYKSASVIVVPSRWQEPFGLIGGEAYSYFKPVVGFNVGGISEWLEDGVNGFLVTENDIKAFAGRIEYLLDNPLEAEKMGKIGNCMTKELFNEEVYLNEIQHLLGEK